MIKQTQVWAALVLIVGFCPSAFSQQNTVAKGQVEQKPEIAKRDVTQEKNVTEYIELLRSNVRQEKAQILGAVMQLSSADAAKFWPIYNEYDAELSKLNKMRSDHILEYAKHYEAMTDAKADELIATAVQYEKLRNDLLAKYYPKMKEAIGSIDAARFMQVEHQLLLIIDLQIASNLPLVEGRAVATRGVQQ
jgi:hypothetical protein